MGSFSLEAIDHVALGVRDQRRSIEWYRDVLGLERRYEEAWGDFPAVLCAGDTCVALFAASAPAQEALPERTGMRHLAFRVDRANFERARAELRDRGIEVEYSDHQISHSIYFADPDGHRIELTTYDV
jgi:catechol 2,3-dioxygenase-like lactoylglutathione lyase family enzyme